MNRGKPKYDTGNEHDTRLERNVKDARILVRLEKTQLGDDIGRFKFRYKVITPETVEDDNLSTKNEDL